VPLHERQHRLAGLAQATFVPRPPHGLANTGSTQLWNHASALDGAQAGAVGQDAGIDHQQFVGSAWFPTEHDPAEPHLGINGQDHFGQLHFPNAMIQSRAQLGHLRVFIFSGQCRKVEFVVNAQSPTARRLGHCIHTGRHFGQQGL
jgi:hypothetical protein